MQHCTQKLGSWYSGQSLKIFSTKRLNSVSATDIIKFRKDDAVNNIHFKIFHIFQVRDKPIKGSEGWEE
jgi:hypothetical protein